MSDRLPYSSHLDALAERPWAVFALISLWLGLEHVILGPYSYVNIGEMGDCVLPAASLLTSGLLGPGVHYWLPTVACGIDRLANSLMYPQALVLLSFLLPGWAAYQIFLLTHYFFAGYFTYRISTDDLQTSRQAAVFAGAAAALTTPFTGSIGSSMLPFVLWSLDRLLDADWKRGLTGAALLGVFYSVFASAVVSMPFCFPWILAWFLLVRRRFNARFLTLFAVFVACFIPLHVQELWAMWLQARDSHRLQWAAELTCTAAGFFDGIANGLRLAWKAGSVQIVVAATGLAAAGFRPGRFGRVWTLLLLTAAAAGLGEWAKGCLMSGSSVLKGVHLHRFYLILPFSTALCGAAGLDLFGRRRWVFPLAMTALLGLSLSVKSSVLWEYYFQGGYTANYRSPVLRDLAAQRSDAEPFRVATFTHGLLPAYALAYGLETVDGYINMYPASYHRFWSKVIEPVIEREPYLNEYFGKWGNQIYLFLHSVDDWPGGIRFADHYRLPLLSLVNTRYIIARHPLSDPNLRLLTPQPPWESLSRKEHALLRLKEIFRGKSYLLIYENTSALPRAFLVGGVRGFPDSATLWDSMGKSSLKDLRAAVYVEAGRWEGTPWPEKPVRGRITQSLYRPDRILMTLALAGPALLVVSNNFNPYWKCTVDGKERPLFPAYGAFWGVRLGKDDRQVEFSYSPPYRLF
ncbi:MAG: DUF6044 family protein [Elusimicrobiota bacterium]|jgi:hypothetical protein